jgi:hypothetical protein
MTPSSRAAHLGLRIKTSPTRRAALLNLTMSCATTPDDGRPSALDRLPIGESNEFRGFSFPAQSGSANAGDAKENAPTA